MSISIKKYDEIQKLKIAGKIVGETLNHLKNIVSIGMSLKEIDKIGEEYIRKLGAEPSFKGLYGFPASVCTSLNEVCIHGIPTDYCLQNGDILGLDLGTKINGYFGDAAITMAIGNISEDNKKLIQCSKDVLYEAISKIEVNMRFKELSFILENSIRSRGFVPLEDFCGHGIGTKPHEEPNILNYLVGKTNQGPRIKNGMVFCLEPMICQKDGRPLKMEDNWSIMSQDRLRTSHYEHTIAMIDNKAVILTEYDIN